MNTPTSSYAMKTENLSFRRDHKQPEDVNVLRKLIAEHITNKPSGRISSNWRMQQCGSSIWYDCSGYYSGTDGEVAVSIRYTWL